VPEEEAPRLVALVALLTGKVASVALPATTLADAVSPLSQEVPSDLVALVARCTGSVGKSKRMQRYHAQRRGKRRKRLGRPRQNKPTKFRAKGPRPPAVSLRRCAIALAMKPGAWYGRPNLRNRSGLAYDSLKSEVRTMFRLGLIEQANNPNWKEAPYIGAPRESTYLFRLTAKGEAFRRFATMLQ